MIFQQLKMASLLSSAILFLFTLQVWECNANHTIVWWEVKPYAYTEKGELKGMFPDILGNFYKYCGNNIIFAVNDVNNHRNNYSRFLDNVKFNLSHINSSDMLIFPILKSNVQLQQKEYIAKTLFHAPGACVVMRKQSISIHKKLLDGIVKTFPMFIAGGCITMSIGIFVWLLEKHFNAEFQRKFPTGMWDGFWWATVTMTTLGYGDMVPRGFISRNLTVFLLFFGMVFIAILTATITDSLSEFDNASIVKKQVAVLRHSAEYRIAEQHDAYPIEYETFEEILDSVRQQRISAALINTHVCSWMQDEIRREDVDISNRLSIVHEIKNPFPVWYFRRNERNPDVADKNRRCFNEHKVEIADEVARFYYNHTKIDTVYSPSLSESFDIQTGYLFHFVITLSAFIVLATIDRIIELLLRRKRQNSLRYDINAMESVPKEDILMKLHVENELLKINKNFEELKQMVNELRKEKMVSQ